MQKTERRNRNGLDVNHLDFLVRKPQTFSLELDRVSILSATEEILGQGSGILLWEWEQQDIRSNLNEIERRSFKSSDGNLIEAIETARRLLDSSAGSLGVHLHSSINWLRITDSTIADRDWTFVKDSSRAKIMGHSGNLEIFGLLEGGCKVYDNKNCFLPLRTTKISSASASQKKYRLVKLSRFPSLFSAKQLRDADRRNQDRYDVPSMIIQIPVCGCVFELQEHHEGGLFLYSEMGNYSGSEHERLETALITAIGFVASQLVTKIIEHQVDDKATTTFHVSPKSEELFVSPLYHYWKEEAPHFFLTGKIAELIFRDDTNQVRSILRHYLTAPGPLFASVRALHICSLLDALFQVLPKILNWPAEDRTSFLADFGKAQAALETCGLNSRNRERIIGAFRSLNDKSLKDKYYYAHFSLNLSARNEEWSIFKIWRNKLAHGKIDDPYEMDEDKYQESVDAMLTFVNLFNRIILAASGYRDKYYDFTCFDYRELS